MEIFLGISQNFETFFIAKYRSEAGHRPYFGGSHLFLTNFELISQLNCLNK